VNLSLAGDQFFKIARNLQSEVRGTVESFNDSSNLGFEERPENALDLIGADLSPLFLEVFFDYGFDTEAVPVEILNVNRRVRAKVQEVTGLQDSMVGIGFADYVMKGVLLPYTLEINGNHPFRCACALNPSRR
jgi:hypothetical protein